MDESKLVRLLGSSAKKEISKEMGERTPCNQFGDSDYRSYIKGEKSLQDMDLFVKHCEECQSCLREIVNLHEARVKEQEQLEDELLLAKTVEFLDFLDKKENGIKENLLDIVIKAARNAVEIVSTTGELLQALQPVNARATDDKVESEPLRIIKEFSTPPLSVQVSVVQGETAGSIGLTVSLYNLDADDFLSRKAVYISASGQTWESTSNASGEVYFNITQPDVYEVAIGDKEKPDVRLIINVVDE